MDAQIRFLAEKDLTVVEKLFLDYLTKSMTNLHLEDVLYDRNCFARVIVDVSDDIPLAFCALSIRIVPSKGRIGTIEDLVVAKNRRGRGFGEMLVIDLLKFAEMEDLQFVNLTSNPTRKSARRIYTKLGFVKLNTTVFRK